MDGLRLCSLPCDIQLVWLYIKTTFMFCHTEMVISQPFPIPDNGKRKKKKRTRATDHLPGKFEGWCQFAVYRNFNTYSLYSLAPVCFLNLTLVADGQQKENSCYFIPCLYLFPPVYIPFLNYRGDVSTSVFIINFLFCFGVDKVPRL